MDEFVARDAFTSLSALSFAFADPQALHEADGRVAFGDEAERGKGA